MATARKYNSPMQKPLKSKTKRFISIMSIILTMIIQRPKEEEKVNSVKKWTLLYGRRKTGKTFLVRNFIKHDEYFFVKSNKNILTKDNQSISYETFLEIMKIRLADNKTIVVDEFHRLGVDFFELLHAMKKQGRLILISSTLYLAKKLINSKSPLLGLFAEIPLEIIDLKDTLRTVQKSDFDKKDKLEIAIMLREPLAIEYYNKELKAEDIIYNIITDSSKSVPALVGEIFAEETRELSGVYEGILRGIALGKSNSGEISNYLFSKRLINKDDPSTIQQYLNNLILFGIIKRLNIFDKKKFSYKIISPLSRIFYYMDEKYNISERKPTKSEIQSILKEVMPKIVEDNIREILAKNYGLRENIAEEKDFGIDGLLLKFKKPEIALEIKWSNMDKIDTEEIADNLNKFNVKKTILFVQDKDNIGENNKKLKIIDIEDLTSD